MSLMVGNSVGQLFGIYGLYLNFIWQQESWVSVRQGVMCFFSGMVK
jgi:hypothetical protein